METLISGSHSRKLFAYKYKDKNRSFLGVRDDLGKSQLQLLRPFTLVPFKHSNVSISAVPPISLAHKFAQPNILLSSLSSSNTQVEVEEEEELQLEEIQSTDMNQTKSVHVKFQLQRECSFGQKFHIVGDDPVFGMWDPHNAVPMTWSNGHLWSVELNIPVGKSIKFKFIMKEGTETIMWQPGPDRVLETWETEKTLTICEYWENAEMQKIIEGVPVFFEQLEGSPVGEESLVVNSGNSLTKAVISEDIAEGKRKHEKEDPILHLNDDVETRGYVLENNGRVVDSKAFSSLNNEGNSILVEDGVPVLVPGLTLPTENTDEEFKIEAEKDISSAAPSVGAGKAKDLNLPELDVTEERAKSVQHMQERAKIISEDKRKLYENDQQETKQPPDEQDQTSTNPFNTFVHLFDDDIEWFRTTLKNFLDNLGIQ